MTKREGNEGGFPLCHESDHSDASTAVFLTAFVFSGPNDVMLDEMERSLHDALCVVQRVLESKKLVTGGGAVEASLNVYLEAFATTLVSCDSFN